MDRFRYKYILSHAHPVKFIAEVLGIISSAYFLWLHNWAWAIIASVSFFLFSTLFLWNRSVDLEHIASTPLGRIMLTYTTPVSFFLYNFSAVPLIYGLWTHNIFTIMLAILVLLVPHFFKK